MQTTLHFTPSSLPPVTPTPFNKSFPLQWNSTTQLQRFRSCLSIKATPNLADDAAVVDYSSSASVFPAEACDIIGGEACDVQMYPEVKLGQEAKSSTAKAVAEQVDREYYDYNSPNTVFPEEACDDLGGEFCEADYKKGIH